MTQSTAGRRSVGSGRDGEPSRGARRRGHAAEPQAGRHAARHSPDARRERRVEREAEKVRRRRRRRRALSLRSRAIEQRSAKQVVAQEKAAAAVLRAQIVDDPEQLRRVIADMRDSLTREVRKPTTTRRSLTPEMGRRAERVGQGSRRAVSRRSGEAQRARADRKGHRFVAARRCRTNSIGASDLFAARAHDGVRLVSGAVARRDALAVEAAQVRVVGFASHRSVQRRRQTVLATIRRPRSRAARAERRQAGRAHAGRRGLALTRSLRARRTSSSRSTHTRRSSAG